MKEKANKNEKVRHERKVSIIKTLPYRHSAQIVAVLELFISSTLQFTLILLVFLSGSCTTFVVQGRVEKDFCSEDEEEISDFSSEYCSWCYLVYLPLTDCVSTATLFIPWLITIGFLMVITLPCLASVSLFKAAFTDEMLDDAMNHCKSWNFVTLSYTIVAGTAIIYKIWVCDELSVTITAAVFLRSLFLWIISKYTRNLREARLLSMWTLSIQKHNTLKSVGIY